MNRLFFFILFFSVSSFGNPEIYGTYKQHIEDGVYSTLNVEKNGEDSVFISMDCQRGGPTYNSGLIAKTPLKLNGNSVRYHEVYNKETPCTIDIEFSEKQAAVTQVSGYGSYCGFGFKVMCDGKFIKQ